MPQPNPPHEKESQDRLSAQDLGPSFEERLRLVFNGPMCFECLNEAKDEAEEPKMSAGEEDE